MFTTSLMDLISDVTVGIYEDAGSKIERDLPDLGSFRHGLMSVKQLKTKEICSRIH